MNRSVHALALAVALTACVSVASAADKKDDAQAAEKAAQTIVSEQKKPSDAKSDKVTVPDSLLLLAKAVAKDSSKFDRLYRIGVMYLDRDQPNEAVRVLTRAHKQQPKDVKVLVNLGAAWDAAGKPVEAQGYYREALGLAPDDSVASCRLASSLYSEGKYQEAVDMLRDTVRARPGSYCAYFTLGVAFADAGIYRDAIRMWKKVVAIAPTSAEAVSAKESIEVLEKFVQQ